MFLIPHYNNFFIFSYLTTIMSFQFEKYQHKNGLFPAAIDSENPEMKNFWIRDNYYIYLAVSKETREKMVRGFQKIVDNTLKK